MTLQEQFSEKNVQNSIALYLASKLLAAGYLVYWSLIDAVQTNAGWYFQYSLNSATYLANPTYSAAITSAKGMVTLVNTLPAVPRFIVRPMNDGSVPADDEVAVPTIAVEIGSADVVRNYEMGTILKWRSRTLIVDGFFRNEQEQSAFQDAFNTWFDHDSTLDIVDHVAGDLSAVGPVTVRGPSVDSQTTRAAEATTFETLLHTQLEYVA